MQDEQNRILGLWWDLGFTLNKLNLVILQNLFELLSKSCPSKPKDSDKIKVTTLEIEVLTAVQVALLTIYGMCKAVDRGMVMSDVKLLEKSGGKSGEWKAS